MAEGLSLIDIDSIKDVLTDSQIEIIIKSLKDLSKTWLSRFTYQPRDPPCKRRIVMLRLESLTTSLIAQGLLLFMMRGSNQQKIIRNMDTTSRSEVNLIFSTLAVKSKSTPGGKFSSFQWMTSFWDIMLVVAMDDRVSAYLYEHFFRIGDNHSFDTPFPPWFYLPGAAHVFAGATEEVIDAYHNELMRFQCFTICVKNALGNKPIQDTKEYKEARMKQRGFIKLAMTDSSTNFPRDQINRFVKKMGIDVGSMLKGLSAINDGQDWVGDPIETMSGVFRPENVKGGSKWVPKMK